MNALGLVCVCVRARELTESVTVHGSSVLACPVSDRGGLATTDREKKRRGVYHVVSGFI